MRTCQLLITQLLLLFDIRNHIYASGCRVIPAFEHALLVRICQLLITQLQILLDPACDPALQNAELKVVLRVVRTVLRHFYRQLRSKCGVFIETLLAGMFAQALLTPECRVAACNVCT